jgi:hypothetical protein
MTDDLKRQFEQLVADPPPPSEVPSESVFRRVRTVRRRRTAGVATLAAAAVVAVTVAAGNLTDINSAPPVSNTPSAPVTVVTAAPTTTPSHTPSTTTTPPKSPTGTTTSTNATGAVHTPKHNTPPPSSEHTPVAPALGLHLTLKPSVKGRVLTLKVTANGTVRVPVGDVTSDGFFSVLGSERYSFGDGPESGSDAGAVNCQAARSTLTGQQTKTLIDWNGQAGPTPPSNHTYAKAGTYTVSYTVRYCGTNGWVPVTKSSTVTVK